MSHHPADRLACIKVEIAALEREAAGLRELLQSGAVIPCGAEWARAVPGAGSTAHRDRRRRAPAAGCRAGPLVTTKRQLVLHLLRHRRSPPRQPPVEPDTGERDAA